MGGWVAGGVMGEDGGVDVGAEGQLGGSCSAVLFSGCRRVGGKGHLI